MSKPSNSDRVLDFHFSIFSDVVSGTKLEEFERQQDIDLIKKRLQQAKEDYQQMKGK
jgi:hypothetical protein